MSDDNAPFVIIGGGQAGGWIAKTLRAEGHSGPVILIGDEADAPYERPPLSKSVLLAADAVTETELLTRPQAAELGIDLRLGESAVAIDRAARMVTLASGQITPYDRLFLTTGSRARVPDWMVKHERVHMLRTLVDAARLRKGLQSTRRLLIVGGGWIGLEIAATARKLGIDVVVIEMADRICGRSLPAPLSDWLAQMHHREGVKFLLKTQVTDAVIDGDQATLTLLDGLQLTGDRVVVGIGNQPNSDLAEKSGLAVSNGIVVDRHCRTSDPFIFAAGDVAAFPCGFAGGQVRRESWANAQNQAIIAAKSALGHDAAYDELPWLWSDQYGTNIQMVGLPERAERLLFKAGAVNGTGSWLALDRAGAVVGAVAVNDPRGLRPIRKELQRRGDVSLDGWSDWKITKAKA